MPFEKRYIEIEIELEVDEDNQMTDRAWEHFYRIDERLYDMGATRVSNPYKESLNN